MVHRKKIVNYGWTAPTLAQMIANTYVTKFDGNVFSPATNNYSLPAFCVEPWATSPTDQRIIDWGNLAIWAAMKDAKFLPDNFIRMSLGGWVGGVNPARVLMDWFDDDHWNVIVANLADAGTAAVVGGCPGICVDPESYDWVDLWQYSGVLFPGKTFAQVHAQVKARGKQFVEAIQSTCPNCVFLCMFFLSFVARNYANWNPANYETATLYKLYPAFCEGMLEGITGAARIVECYEVPSYFNHETRQAFLEATEVLTRTPADMLTGDLATKYQAYVEMGAACYADLWLDQMYVLEPDFALLREACYKNQIYTAYATAKEFVWMYSQVRSSDLWSIGAPADPDPQNWLAEMKALYFGQKPLPFDLVKDITNLSTFWNRNTKPAIVSTVSASVALRGQSGTTATAVTVGDNEGAIYVAGQEEDTVNTDPDSFSLTGLSAGDDVAAILIDATADHGISGNAVFGGIDYYVRKGATGGDGSEERPWGTLAEFVAGTVDGDLSDSRLHVAGDGTTNTLDGQCLLSLRVNLEVLQWAGSDAAYLDFSAATTDDGTFEKTSGWVGPLCFSNLNIKCSKDADGNSAIRALNINDTLSELVARNCVCDGSHHAIFVSVASKGIVEVDSVTVKNSIDYAVYLANFSGTAAAAIRRSTFFGNTQRDVYLYGFTTGTAVVESNTTSNTGKHAFRCESISSGTVRVSCNLFKDAGTAGASYATIYGHTNSIGLVIARNTLINGLGPALEVASSATGWQIVGNIFYGKHLLIPLGAETNLLVANNCFWAPNAGSTIAIYKGVTYTRADSAAFFAALSADNPLSVGNICADPLFIDATGGDYDLDPDSPCIDAGVAIAGVTEDINGNPIPNGNAPDIGCHEAQTISGKASSVALAVAGIASPGYVSPLARRRRR